MAKFAKACHTELLEAVRPLDRHGHC